MAEPDVAGNWRGDWLGNFHGGWDGDCRAEAAGFLDFERSPFAIPDYAIHIVWAAGRGAGDCNFFYPRGRRVRICFGLLCGAGGDDSDCRERVYVHLRDDGGVDRVDYWVGFDSGIRR